jgi:hypothetical protein
MIQSTAFGTITIAGRTYTSDVLIFPDGRVEDRWRRRQGHALQADDLLPLVEAAPELIVVGTGTAGRVRPDPSLRVFLDQRGIALLAAPNSRAMAVYNDKLAEGVTVAAGFHLTC